MSKKNRSSNLDPQPPAWALGLLQHAVHLDADGRSIVGDLYEEFLKRAQRAPKRASLWFCYEALALSCTMRLLGRARTRRQQALKAPNSKPRAKSRHIEAWIRDTRYGLRRALRNPTFSCIAVGSLAIGIGFCAFIFSLINATLLRAKTGIEAPKRIVEVWRSQENAGFDTLSYPDVLDLRAALVPETLENLAVFVWDVVSYNEGDGSDRLSAMYISANYLSVLGVRLAMGQGFSNNWDEHQPKEPVVIVSHRFWSAHHSQNENPSDATLHLGGQDLSIVGVLPKDFEGHLFGFRPDVYLPISQHPKTSGQDSLVGQRRSSWLFSLARLADNVSLETANAGVATVYEGLASQYPESNTGRGGAATAYGSVPAELRPAISGFFAMLMGLVILVLLITCANVSGMQLASAAARRREIAVRTAVGASRRQLIRQLSCESGLLFVAGGFGGTLIAYVATRILANGQFVAIPVLLNLDVTLDWRGVIFSLVITLAAALLFGVLPVLQSTQRQITSGLRSTTPADKLWIRRTLVVAQIAASMILLVTAGLFLRSVQAMANTPTGFSSENVFTASIDPTLDGIGDSEEALQALYRTLQERLSATPSVESVAFATDLPLDLATNRYSVLPEGWEGTDVGGSSFGTSLNFISGSYQEALGVHQFEGRAFLETDRGVPVAIVNREFARKAWPDGSALDHWVDVPDLDPPLRVRVVGVVDNVKSGAINEPPRAALLLPLEQSNRSTVHLFVRSKASQGSAVQTIRRAIAEANSDLSHTIVLPLGEAAGLGSVPQRAAAVIASTLGMVALLLSALGLYGVVSFSVAARTHEIGVRIALGAWRNKVLSGVLRDAAVLAIPGLLVGLALGLGTAQLARSFLVGVTPTDIWSIIGAMTAVVAILLAASLVPATRAANVDPVKALRAE